MDHAARGARAEERLPGGLLSPERALLRKVPALAFGQDEDITLCGALASALFLSGDERRVAYDDAAAGSGVAFQLRIDDRWDPATTSPHDPEVAARAAECVGLRADAVPAPWDADMRELVWERAVESIDAEIPVLVRGKRTGDEFGLVTGYDAEHRLAFLDTYVAHDDRKPEPLFADEDPLLVFLEKGTRPKDAELARRALERARAITDPATHEMGDTKLFQGEAAFAAWIAALGEPTSGRAATERAFVDHARRVFLHDARRTAARYLRRARRLFPDRAGAELIRAAEEYGYVAEECEKTGTAPFEAGVVARFLDPGWRKGWAHALERAAAHEREAIAALRAVRA